MSTRNDDRRRERQPRPSGEQQPTRQRATDQEIQKWISRQHGFVPESAWLLQCKELFGLAAPGTRPKRIRVRQRRLRRFSKHSGGLDCFEQLAGRAPACRLTVNCMAAITHVPCYVRAPANSALAKPWPERRSEEHTSELQSHHDLVCRL